MPMACWAGSICILTLVISRGVTVMFSKAVESSLYIFLSTKILEQFPIEDTASEMNVSMSPQQLLELEQVRIRVVVVWTFDPPSNTQAWSLLPQTVQYLMIVIPGDDMNSKPRYCMVPLNPSHDGTSLVACDWLLQYTFKNKTGETLFRWVLYEVCYYIYAYIRIFITFLTTYWYI